jgi:hypothetical protein
MEDTVPGEIFPVLQRVDTGGVAFPEQPGGTALDEDVQTCDAVPIETGKVFGLGAVSGVVIGVLKPVVEVAHSISQAFVTDLGEVVFDYLPAFFAFLYEVFNTADRLVRGGSPVGEDTLVLVTVATNPVTEAVTSWDLAGIVYISLHEFLRGGWHDTVNLLSQVDLLQLCKTGNRSPSDRNPIKTRMTGKNLKNLLGRGVEVAPRPGLSREATHTPSRKAPGVSN